MAVVFSTRKPLDKPIQHAKKDGRVFYACAFFGAGFYFVYYPVIL